MRISPSNSRNNESGMAVIVVIAILSIILIFVAGNLRTLYLLRSDLRFVENQQTNRLAHATQASVPATGDAHPSPLLRTK